MVDGGSQKSQLQLGATQKQLQLVGTTQPLSALPQLEEDLGSSVSRSLPPCHSSHPLLPPTTPAMTRSESTTTTSEELTIENSLIGSRVPLIPRSISGW